MMRSKYLNVRIIAIAAWIMSWHSSYALLGLGASTPAIEPVMIMHDSTWELQLAQWTESLKRLDAQIGRFDSLIQDSNRVLQIIGDPSSVIESVSTVGGAVDQLHAIVRSDNTRNLKDLVHGIQRVDGRVTRINKTIDDSILLGDGKHAKKRKRNVSLYSSYNLLERMRDELDSIIEADDRIQDNERRRQRSLIDDLSRAVTEWDRERIRAAIEQSKAVQAASSAAVQKAKAEYEAEKMAIEIEREKQALAEWEQETYQEEYREELRNETAENYRKFMQEKFYGREEYGNKIHLNGNKPLSSNAKASKGNKKDKK